LRTRNGRAYLCRFGAPNRRQSIAKRFAWRADFELDVSVRNAIATTASNDRSASMAVDSSIHSAPVDSLMFDATRSTMLLLRAPAVVLRRVEDFFVCSFSRPVVILLIHFDRVLIVKRFVRRLVEAN
jgi:hypothetical protein